MDKQPVTLVMEFGIETPLCYLSHRETVTLFERALIRAGLSPHFSAGFNPRPRLSLPFPRSVGVRGDRELLCAMLEPSEQMLTAEQIVLRLAGQLPEGLTIGTVRTFAGKITYHPQSVLYVFNLTEHLTEHKQEQLNRLGDMVLSGDTINIRRQKPGQPGPSTVNIGQFIMDLQWQGSQIRLRCRVGPDGTARVEEMLEWLGFKPVDLDGPVYRTDIQWNTN